MASRVGRWHGRRPRALGDETRPDASSFLPAAEQRATFLVLQSACLPAHLNGTKLPLAVDRRMCAPPAHRGTARPRSRSRSIFSPSHPSSLELLHCCSSEVWEGPPLPSPSSWTRLDSTCRARNTELAKPRGAKAEPVAGGQHMDVLDLRLEVNCLLTVPRQHWRQDAEGSDLTCPAQRQDESSTSLTSGDMTSSCAWSPQLARRGEQIDPREPGLARCTTPPGLHGMPTDG
jgi:hypothetical protein